MDKIVYENGLHATLTNEQYHSSSGYSRSQIMTLMQTPYHFWYKYLSGDYAENGSTPALTMGNLIHILVLQPELFPLEYIIMPDCDKRTKEGKERYNLFMERKGEKEAITQSQYDDARKIALSVKNNPVIAELLQGTKIEQSIYFTHEPTGLQCKVRPDAWLGTLAFDLKTTENASKKAFQSSAMTYGYFLQAAMNYKAFESIGIELDEFIFLPVEKKPPYATGIYRCLRDKLDADFELFDSLMERLKTCLDTNEWPDYGIQELERPKWAKYNDLMEIE